MLLFQYDCVTALWLAAVVPCLKIHPLARQGPGRAAGASEGTSSVPELRHRGRGVHRGGPSPGLRFVFLLNCLEMIGLFPG